MTTHEVAWMIAIALFSLKHFIADFVLQNEYMLGKFKKPPECFKPLASHCGVHMIFAFILFIIPIALEPLKLHSMWPLVFALVVYEGISHFLVDIVKAQYTRINKLRPTDQMFWVAIGIDQMMHTIFAIPLVYYLSVMIQSCI